MRRTAAKVVVAAALTASLGLGLHAISRLDTATRLLHEEAKQDALADTCRQSALLLAVACSMAVVTVALWFLNRRARRPVRLLVEGARRLAAGDFDQPIALSGQDDLGELARLFNENAEKLARAHRQLLDAQKLASAGRLAASVAHEINNPLTGILSSAEVLRDEIDPGHRPDVDTIINEALRCREIARRLLDVARRRPPAKKPADLNQLVARVIEPLERQEAFIGVTVVRRLAPGLPDVLLDAKQFHQVLVNLLVNAAEAMHGSGVITVTTETSSDGGSVVLHVSDTGPGVPPEVRSHILDPFFTTKKLGTGLGLPEAWRIVRQHEGRLYFVTELDRGTTFTVELPVTPRDLDGAHDGDLARPQTKSM